MLEIIDFRKQTAKLSITANNTRQTIRDLKKELADILNDIKDTEKNSRLRKMMGLKD